jgi:chemotaxis protein CheX
MPMDSPSQSAVTSLALSETLDLRAAGPLAASLLAARGGAIKLDASRVRSIGAQCMQVIFSARQTWDRDGQSLTIVNPTADFLDALTVAGLSVDNILEGEPGR